MSLLEQTVTAATWEEETSEQTKCSWHLCYNTKEISHSSRLFKHLLNLKLPIYFSPLSKHFPAVWPDQRLGSVWLQLLQVEYTNEEELVSSQAWLCAGGRWPGVHNIWGGEHVCSRSNGSNTSGPLDWALHPGKRKTKECWEASDCIWDLQHEHLLWFYFPEMQQDFLSLWKWEQRFYLVRFSPAELHKLGRWSTHSVRFCNNKKSVFKL